METEELKIVAEVLADEVPIEQGAEFMDVLFDVIYERLDQGQRDQLYNELLAVGIDVGPICKKKRPQ